MKKILLILFFSGFIFSAFSQGNATIFLKFSDDAITGDSFQEGFESFVEALSVSYGVSNPGAAGGAGGGGATKANFSDFNFLHYVSSNSPIFNLYVANGKNIQKVEIFFWKINQTGQQSLAYIVTLEGVTVTSVSTTTSADCNLCAVGVESISLSYSKITWEDQKKGIERNWNIATNQAD